VHYIPPISITSYIENSFPEDQFIYISTPSVNKITYVIKPIGGASGDYIYGTVSANSPATYDVRDSRRVPAFSSQIVIPESLGATVLKNKGYIIEAEKPIYVSARFQSQAQAGAIVSKGSAALSSSFLFGAFVNDVTPIVTEYNSFFSVMAAEDDTDITIVFPKSVKLHNYTGAYPVTFKLQKNESYVGILRISEDTNNSDGLIGGSLVSSKDVVVISGSSTGTNGPGNGHDYGIDQLVGTGNAGEEFIFIRGEAPDFYNDTENILLVPLNAGTTYNINGGAAIPIKGAYALIEGNNYNSNKNMYVVTSGPVMAYQGIGGVSPNRLNHEPNQGMFVVPPLSCSAKGGINNIPFINRIGNNSHSGAIGIVAEKGEDVLLNGALLTNPLNTDNPKYVTYRISNLNQNLYDVNSAGELYVSYYTYSSYATSGGFYSGFQSAPEFDFDLSLVALGTCIQNSLVLNATNLSGLDSYSWWYNPSQQAEVTQWQEITTNANLSSITPTQVGWYQLRGIYSCGSNTENLNSQVIFIGNCPDDTDKDGVVDNLDLDKDNDGVLNRFESGGDIIPDFTDPNSPLLPSTTDKNISLPSTYGVSASLNTDTNGVLSGDNLGNMTSQLKASSGAVNTYELNFTEPTTVSIVFPQNPNYVENEIITVSTTDSNKTISLINTSDELLVDTNYDSAYESGVQYFTNNRVSVKYSPSATTLNNSEFISSSLTNISITHTLENVTKDGELTFQIKIIDHPIDTENDNIPDHSDLDSDNDSCFDVTEAGNEDPDNDGLAGASPIFYDPTNAASTADVRGRVFYSGYDFNTQPLDNDNNTIYDFQEPSPIPSFSSQPMTTTVTEGDTAQFSVVTTNATSYKWLMNGVAITNDATFNISTDGKTLSISTTDTSLDGKKFSVFINDDAYLCTSSSTEATLNVLAIPTIPTLDRVYSFCFSGLAADVKLVSDLKGAIGRTDINIYENETGGTPLADTDPLDDGEDYFVSAVNSLGAESPVRSVTNVIIASPKLDSSEPSDAVCLGGSITITATGVPQTVFEFESRLDSTYEKFLSYGGSHYFLRKVAMTWTNARNLIQSQGAGASMYVIDNKSEENAVYNKLLADGYAGTAGTHFWLGLRQIDALKGNSFDEGWVWLNGTPLDPALANWRSGEPNDWDIATNSADSDGIDDGSEDFAQFDFNPSGIEWNDMADNGSGGNSWPVFEFEGVSSVKWYKQEVGGAKTQITGMTSNSIVETPPVTTTYFYETTVNGVVCEDSITITVNDLPTILPASDITECDNNLDGDSTDINEAEFDLMQQRKDMLLSVADRNIFFYETNTASVADSIATATTYTNSANPQTLFYKVVNTVTGCVSNTFGSFKLIVDDLPLEISIADLHDCDDDTVGSDKDGEHTFDLTAKTNEILTALGGTGKAFAISYHKTLTDAKDNTGGITSYTTQTTDSGEKEIFVRIKDPNTGCVRYDNSFKVIVDKLPTALISTMEVEQCETDGQIKYNLNSLVDHFSSNYANETFAFYVDAALTTPVVDAENFVVPPGVSTQDVYIKIIDNSTLCERSDDVFTAGGSREPIRITFTVGKNDVPTTFTPLTFYDCVDESSGTPVTGTFDPSIFNDIRADLLAADPDYNLPNVEISFYKSELDAVFQRDVIDVTQPLIVNPPLKTQEIWVGIQDVGVKIKCLGRIKVADLILAPYPTFDLPATQVFCINLGVDTIIITNQGDTYTYSWALDGSPFAQTSASITITSGGTYEVTATNTLSGCEISKTIVVDESEFPLFDLDDLTVFDLTGNGSNRIEVLTGIGALGIGDYVFSLDGGPYQDSPVFEDVSPGIHQVSVKDKNGCGTKSVEASVIGYPLYFTPNSNGTDDTWQILGVNGVFQAKSLIYIFDRHGRLLAQIAPDGPGWDGTYNGARMPSDDYWFRVGLEDGRTFTGHFSLIR
jgi:gliding motility-associated-like protein